MEHNDARAFWNQQSFAYAAGMDPGLGRFLQWYEEDCWRYIEPRLPKPGAGLILEAGCGAGRWAWRLAPLGHRLVLSDLSPRMIDHARAKARELGLEQQIVSYHVLDICEMQALPDAHFDLVLALGGPLSLCRSPQMAVRELSRLARPGGYVLADAANRYRTALDVVQSGQIAQLRALLQKGVFERTGGLCDCRFGPDELVALFRDFDLRPERLGAVCPLFPYLPSLEQAQLLDDAETHQALRQVSARHAEDQHIISVSGRMLIAAQRHNPE